MIPIIDQNNHMKRLNDCISRMIQSDHPKKIIVAGPGAGKTTSFLRLLEHRKFDRQKCLVFTFLKALREDLKQKLEQSAMVFTFHGYCINILSRYHGLRGGLKDDFEIFPKIPDIIADDWEIINECSAPIFKEDIRSSVDSDAVKFFLKRGNYYNAIGFDDSVFRVYSSLKKKKIKIPYSLILVDEAQDFNRLEINFIYLMTGMGPTLIVGDDDQALYSFRLAKPDYIREIYDSPEFEKHKLPYCTRCTEVIVDAFHDVVNMSTQNGLLSGRIGEEFNYCPPIKEADSKQYPKIEVVKTSVHNRKVNYFGRYIEQEIGKISQPDVAESLKDKIPTVLIISSNPFRKEIENYLKEVGLRVVSSKRDDIIFPERDEILRHLLKKPDSNLWWRAILMKDKPLFYEEVIRETKEESTLKEILPGDYCKNIIHEAESLGDITETEDSVDQTPEDNRPIVQVTTYQGAKGLSALHVFVVGLQNGVIPLDPRNIKDIEIRKFLVALTRAKKHCHLLYTGMSYDQWVNPSVFISWIKENRKREICVNKEFVESLRS